MGLLARRILLLSLGLLLSCQSTPPPPRDPAYADLWALWDNRTAGTAPNAEEDALTQIWSALSLETSWHVEADGFVLEGAVATPFSLGADVGREGSYSRLMLGGVRSEELRIGTRSWTRTPTGAINPATSGDGVALPWKPRSLSSARAIPDPRLALPAALREGRVTTLADRMYAGRSTNRATIRSAHAVSEILIDPVEGVLVRMRTITQNGAVSFEIYATFSGFGSPIIPALKAP